MKMELPEEWLNFLREQFPEGSRIQLRSAADNDCPVKPGSTGVLTGIDENGQFHVTWESGQVSNLTTADKFRFLPPEPETLKFYMPLTAEVFEPDEYGDMGDEPFYLDGDDLLRYEDQIIAQMVRERMPEEGGGTRPHALVRQAGRRGGKGSVGCLYCRKPGWKVVGRCGVPCGGKTFPVGN